MARLHAALEAEREVAEQWRQVAEDRRVTLERLRQRPVVRLLFRVASVVLPRWRRLRHRGRRIARWFAGPMRAARNLPGRVGLRRRARQLARAVDALPSAPTTDRRATVVVLTRDGRDNLARLLPALRERTHLDAEILVVDNASRAPTRRWLEQQRDTVRVLRLDDHHSFAAANNRAAQEAQGDTLVFLNDDTVPLSRGWLGRLLARLDDRDVVACGAQLVYPRRSLLSAPTRDLSVQHAGITFRPVPGGVPRPVNIGEGAEPDVGGRTDEVAGATAACLAVDRRAFAAAGGFDERYRFGAEDVDLCWSLRRAGGKIVVARDAVLLHHEGATRHGGDPEERNRRQEHNWDLFAAKLGPEVTRAVARDRLAGEQVLSDRPFHLAITITRDLESAGYGDYYTAHELGGALQSLGWRITYVERYRDAWYDLPDDLDAVLSLLDTFDLRRVRRPGLTTIAWVRNWAQRWAASAWFGDYDLVLASSRRIAATLAEHSHHEPVVFPLATNPDRFAAPPGEGIRHGAVFTGSYWGRDERIADAVRAVPQLVVYGRGWGQLPAVRDRWRGQVPYRRLPEIYRDAAVVVDQAGQHTREEGSLNSRVFDGLAAGAMVVTDQAAGAAEVFGDRLPTWEDPEQLAGAVDRWLVDDEGRETAVADLRAEVLAEHTYDARARRFRDLLLDRVERPSFVLATSVPDRRVADTWGDWHLAEALGRELAARGHHARVIARSEWDDRDHRAPDVFVHLKGRSVAPRAEGQTHVIWNISHPEELTPEECDAADLVLVAATGAFVDEVAAGTDTPVSTLLQATDPDRFRPRPPVREHAHDVVFVGNSRFVNRPVVQAALSADLQPVIYGANWEKFVAPDRIQATHVPNDELARVYSSAAVVLNDHWDGMRRRGFVSNRLFDVLACGGVVVSDPVEGLDELFDGAVATWTDARDLGETVRRLLADPGEREERARRGRAAVLAGHTFAHRAGRLVKLLGLHVQTGDDQPPQGDIEVHSR